MRLQRVRRSVLGGLFAVALAATTGSLTASATEAVETTSTPLAVEHIVIKTNKPYPQVKAGIETLGRFDDGMRAMLAKNDIEGLRAAAQRIQGVDGLAIHYVALHGDLLALKGERRPLIAYYIGNILSATEMTKINPAAGLYAPLRVVVYANQQGGTTMEYDQPTSMFGQFKNAEIDAVAQSLDQRLFAFLKKVSM
jgi:uncharacterized protein (DUF302 family)